MDKDLYEILGVSKDATDAQVRKAFLALAKKYHPDVNPGDSEAERKFKEVNFAHEVLKDRKKRQQYDQMRRAPQSPFGPGAGRGWSGQGAPAGGFNYEAFSDFGLGDLFQEIFGGSAGFPPGGARRGRAGGGFPQRGADLQARVGVSFADAVRGGERALEFSGGRRLSVKIPAGIESGSKIKLSGQGDPGQFGGPSGDLILTVDVHPHPHFRREGPHIVLKLPITFAEAVLGGEVEVPTLDGKVVMRIPKGVSSGQRLKLKGKGVAASSTQGDQLVELSIQIPKQPDASYEEAAETLRANAFNPRADLITQS